MVLRQLSEPSTVLRVGGHDVPLHPGELHQAQEREVGRSPEPLRRGAGQQHVAPGLGHVAGPEASPRGKPLQWELLGGGKSLEGLLAHCNAELCKAQTDVGRPDLVHQLVLSVEDEEVRAVLHARLQHPAQCHRAPIVERNEDGAAPRLNAHNPRRLKLLVPTAQDQRLEKLCQGRAVCKRWEDAGLTEAYIGNPQQRPLASVGAV
mmetsp:Transcript_34148/g.101882  ORF Transcript_34148/g.101882 Transcript_34148/m.101882 type:complete len:206 (+) Transcript_34148:653-1270(+)